MEKAKREVHFSLKWGKLDIIVTLLTLLIGIFLSVFVFFMPVEEGSLVSVYYNGDELISLPLRDESVNDPRYIILFKGEITSEYDDEYKTEYKFADCSLLIEDLIIEIDNGGITIVKETSPNHICSAQGTISRPNIPLTCAPNYVMVIIHSAAISDNPEIPV